MNIGRVIKDRRSELGLTLAELGKRIGVSEATVQRYESNKVQPRHEMLVKLAEALDIKPATLMGWDTPTNIVEPPKMHPIPIVACIPAGIPVFSETDIEGYELADVKNPEGHVFVRVKGDSMIGAGILDGDLALIRLQSTAENGDIVACQVNGDCETTLKRFKQEGTTILLLPANTAYDPYMLTAKQFEREEARILGVLAGISRKY